VQERLLGCARVVLVAPKHATNVGAVARVCDNFEVCMILHVLCTFFVFTDGRCCLKMS
jgi:tRNA C32,U32 (ribose-2'-O)-methylase TrmJ